MGNDLWSVRKNVFKNMFGVLSAIVHKQANSYDAELG